LRATLVLALLAVACPLRASDLALPWSQAEYRARKMFMTVRLGIGLQRLTRDAATSALQAPFEGQGIVPAGDEVVLVSLRTRTGSKTKETLLYLDPANGAALRRQQQEWSSDPDFKDLRYTTTGIARLRAEPLDGEADQPPTTWGQVRRQFRAFSAAGDAGVVSDTAALPFLVATATWRQPGDRTEFRVFEDGQIVTITATADGWTETSVDFRTDDGKLQGRQKLLNVSLVTTTAGDGGDADIDLFGLSGDVRLLVDVERRVPVEISGSVSFFGEIRFALKAISRQAPAAG
jgi:hypothetical protein